MDVDSAPLALGGLGARAPFLQQGYAFPSGLVDHHSRCREGAQRLVVGVATSDASVANKKPSDIELRQRWRSFCQVVPSFSGGMIRFGYRQYDVVCALEERTEL
jgi:hypothetical protein